MSQRGDSSLPTATHHRMLNGWGSISAHMCVCVCVCIYRHRHTHGKKHHCSRSALSSQRHGMLAVRHTAYITAVHTSLDTTHQNMLTTAASGAGRCRFCSVNTHREERWHTPSLCRQHKANSLANRMHRSLATEVSVGK